jgi:hypothetical protein
MTAPVTGNDSDTASHVVGVRDVANEGKLVAVVDPPRRKRR